MRPLPRWLPAAGTDPNLPHGTPAQLDMVSSGALAHLGQVSQSDGDLIAPEGCAGDTESAIWRSLRHQGLKRRQ
jgi:hypothetical protein